MEHNRPLSILRELEMTGPFPDNEYVRTMERRFGAKANRFMDAVDEAFAELTGPNQETWQRLYRLKNSDAQMSAYVSAHQCSTLYAAFLAWLETNLGDDPKRVIELGCDAGLLTLAIGKLIPESSVL